MRHDRQEASSPENRGRLRMPRWRFLRSGAIRTTGWVGDPASRPRSHQVVPRRLRSPQDGLDLRGPMTHDQSAIPAGYWQREASHNPRPMTPLGSSLFIEAARKSLPKVFAELGLLAEVLEYRSRTRRDKKGRRFRRPRRHAVEPRCPHHLLGLQSPRASLDASSRLRHSSETWRYGMEDGGRRVRRVFAPATG
jgi:hypothetical protein